MTEFPIDQSNLPRVQDVRRDFSVLEDGALAHCLQEQEIEQHYASNVQKNKLVQKDIRIAKKLQDEEDERNKIRSLERQRLIEERDSEYARVIQEELSRKARECREREEEDKEIAKRLQELEKEEVLRRSRESPTSNHGDLPPEPNQVDLLGWRMAELVLPSGAQLQRDEELAWRLQEEEKQLTTTTHRERHADFRAAQVAQDEEIAKYIQRQELKSRRWSEESDRRRKSADDSSGSGSSSERRRRNTDQANEVTGSGQGRLDSTGYSVQERTPLPSREAPDGEKQLTPRNIAEELDPTFQSNTRAPRNDAFTGCAQERSSPSQPCAVPVDGFYDFMDDPMDPAFISPTKRQSDKAGRHKRDNCKQQ